MPDAPLASKRFALSHINELASASFLTGVSPHNTQSSILPESGVSMKSAAFPAMGASAAIDPAQISASRCVGATAAAFAESSPFAAPPFINSSISMPAGRAEPHAWCDCQNASLIRCLPSSQLNPSPAHPETNLLKRVGQSPPCGFRRSPALPASITFATIVGVEAMAPAKSRETRGPSL
jgi:hypothetical protein